MANKARHQQHQQRQQQHHTKYVQDLANLKLNVQESNNNQKNANTYNGNSNVNVNHIQFPESDETKLARQMLHMKHQLQRHPTQDFDFNGNTDITDFVSSNKNDSKLHTLSYSANRLTKCNAPASISNMILASAATTTTTTTAAGKTIAMGKDAFDDVNETGMNANQCDNGKVEHEPTEPKGLKSGFQHRTHTAEQLSAINSKTTSTANITTSGTAHSNQQHRSDGKSIQKSKLSSPHQIPSGNLVVPPRKPISSVAPTSITPSVKSTIPSPRVHAVAPNINSTPILSASSTTTATATTTDPLDKSRPALPPKPKSNDSNSSSSSNSSCSSSNESSPSSSHGNGLSGTNGNRNKSSTSIPTLNALTNMEKMNAENNNIQPLSSHIQYNIDFPIKAKPLTIKKQPLSEQPRLRSLASGIKPIQYSSSRRIEMPSTLLFPEHEKTRGNDDEIRMTHPKPIIDTNKPKSLPSDSSNSSIDENDKSPVSSVSSVEMEKTIISQNSDVVRRQKTSMSDSTKTKSNRRVSFDPLALLLDASLEGELELVQKTASQVSKIFICSFTYSVHQS